MKQLVGRAREMRVLAEVLDGLGGRRGELVAIVGPSGAGTTALADALVVEAESRGIRVVRRPGASMDPVRLAELIVDAEATLVVVDDMDRAAFDTDALRTVAGDVAASSTALVVTAHRSLGVGREVRVPALSADELAAVLSGAPVVSAKAADGLWLASGGRPGTALELAGALSALGPNDDPTVFLALRARSTTDFLDVDPDVVRLLDAAIERADDDATRGRLLARLAHELLGDASAGDRRRALADEALDLVTRADDPDAVAAVLDDRLSALWDPSGATDRLETATRIVVLARRSGDRDRERRGLFWRFVALVELGRVAEAEAALATYERASGDDPTAAVVVTSRRAALAILRGRYDLAERLIDDVRVDGHRYGMADADRLVDTLWGAIAADRGPASEGEWEAAIERILALSLRLPGHHFETIVGVILVTMGRHDEAAVELERLLPQVLGGSGPRWLAAMAELAVIAAETGNAEEAARIEAGMAPYRGALVIRGGANTILGPASHFLGVLAAVQGRREDAAVLLAEAITFQEEIGALPGLARSSWALADALGDGPVADGHRARARSIAELLGLGPLLARASAAADQWSLSRDGEDWVLTARDEQVRLRDTRGVGYLRSLLAAPGVEIAALDLVAGGQGLAAEAAVPVLDEAARAGFRARLEALEGDLDAADRAGDAARAAVIEAERAALLDELRRATGLGGRPRAVSNEAERARVNVTRTLRATLERIAAAAPQCGRHLQASIQTGRTCRYQPAAGGPERWRL